MFIFGFSAEGEGGHWPHLSLRDKNARLLRLAGGLGVAFVSSPHSDARSPTRAPGEIGKAHTLGQGFSLDAEKVTREDSGLCALEEFSFILMGRAVNRASSSDSDLGHRQLKAAEHTLKRSTTGWFPQLGGPRSNPAQRAKLPVPSGPGA